jgi:hypothetical protein
MAAKWTRARETEPSDTNCSNRISRHRIAVSRCQTDLPDAHDDAGRRADRQHHAEGRRVVRAEGTASARAGSGGCLDQQVNIVGADGKPYSTTRYGVTDQFFEVFGSRMALGRAFERGQNPGPLVISYATWRDLFGLDPEIIGKTVNAEGFPRPVVGVTREEFEFREKPGSGT